MAGAVVTSPFDVVKTRLQSDMFRTIPHTSPVALGPTTAVIRPSGAGGLLWNFVETGHIIRYASPETNIILCWLILPLTSVIFTNTKVFLRCSKALGLHSLAWFPLGQSISSRMEMASRSSLANSMTGRKTLLCTCPRQRLQVLIYLAVMINFVTDFPPPGVVTATATNPIWVVKTRMQLSASGPTPFTSAFQCTAHILRHDGIPGLYKGLSASYLGVTEGVIQWVLYERLKIVLTPRENASGLAQWAGMMGAAGGAKFSASLITYPHEVRDIGFTA
jgi:solute carrier family 25 protein 33/36